MDLLSHDHVLIVPLTPAFELIGFGVYWDRRSAFVGQSLQPQSWIQDLLLFQAAACFTAMDMMQYRSNTWVFIFIQPWKRQSAQTRLLQHTQITPKASVQLVCVITSFYDIFVFNSWTNCIQNCRVIILCATACSSASTVNYICDLQHDRRKHEVHLVLVL